jgi:Domain of unknown function (DUF4397)
MARPFSIAFIVLAVVLSAVPAAAQEASGQRDRAKVTFLHGIRGMLADVYLDDKLILRGFAPERATEPMAMSAGSHRIDLRMADAPPDSKPAVTKKFKVPKKGRLTAIAHWTGVDDCIITVYDETGAAVSAGAGRLITRHAAATDDVRLTVDDRPLGTALAPAKQLADTVKPGTHTVAIKDATSNTMLVSNSRVPIPEGVARIVYLVGTAKDDSLNLLTQTVDGLESNPSGVPTGNSGLADDRGPEPLPIAALVFAAVATLLAVRRRQRGVADAHG